MKRKQSVPDRLTNADIIIENLKRPYDPSQNGTLVTSTPENGSFKAINTPIDGIEVDVDEL